MEKSHVTAIAVCLAYRTQEHVGVSNRGDLNVNGLLVLSL